MNHFSYYKNCTVITPNHLEAGNAVGHKIKNFNDVHYVGRKIFEKLNPDYVLITYGEKGMVLLEDKGAKMYHFEAVAKEVYDVTGAGDTVVSALSLALASNASIIDAMIISNFSAGVVVGKVGTATTTVDEIKKSIRYFVEQ